MDATNTFSLLDNPWIPVLRTDGTKDELALRTLLAEADDIIELVGESPTQNFTLIRLLLAILHRAIDGPNDPDEWADLYESGQLPQQEIKSYLNRYEHRFHLFHPGTPFYQVADLHTAKHEVSTLEKLLADVPAGGQLFTGRANDALARISLPEAARWLIQVQGYDISGIKTGAVGDPRVKGGKGYPIGTGHAGSLGGIYIDGKTLSDTLLLNLVSNKDIGTPVWEREPHTAAPEGHAEELRTPTGITDLYTWQSRRIRLVRQDDWVTGIVLSNGDKILPNDTYPLEPMTMWRRSPAQEKKLKRKLVYFPRTHDPHKSLWRSAESLLPIAGQGGSNGSEPAAFESPGVVQHLRDRVEDGDLDEHTRVTVRAIGMEYGAHSASTVDVISDTLTFQASVITDDVRRHGLVGEAVERATEACKALGLFAADLIRAAGGDGDAQVGARDTARESGYEAIDRGFRAWLADLDTPSEPKDPRIAWQRQVKKELNALSERLIATAPPSAYAGVKEDDRYFNVAISQRRFTGRLKKALPAAFESPEPERSAS